MRRARPSMAAAAACVAGLALAGCQGAGHVVVEQLPMDSILDARRPGPSPRPAVEASARRPAARAASVPASWLPAGSERPWRWIIVHHSASGFGSAAIFDRWHRDRGWDELGYHFVVTNGRGGPDGMVQVGSRWGKQKWGAHCKTPGNECNDYGIGICLVGSFGDSLPSKAQLASLRGLVLFLVGRYGIDPAHVIGHGDAPGARTECPGATLSRYLDDVLRPEVARRSRLARSR